MSIPTRRTLEIIDIQLTQYRCTSCDRRFATPGELCLHQHRCVVSARAAA
jgi:hypothetical protein